MGKKGRGRKEEEARGVKKQILIIFSIFSNARKFSSDVCLRRKKKALNGLPQRTLKRVNIFQGEKCSSTLIQLTCDL